MSETLTCAECGMQIAAADEFHPWIYCLLVKNGAGNPEDTLAAYGFFRSPVFADPTPTDPA